ncbi:MAG: hypothetical protein AAF747_00270 [Planctomycetota bacterium]
MTKTTVAVSLAALAGAAAGQATVYAENFDNAAWEADSGSSEFGNNGASAYVFGEPSGNGSNSLFVQGFANAADSADAGITWPVAGTLAAGTTYILTFEAWDFQQNWTTAGEYEIGFSAAALDQATTPDFFEIQSVAADGDGVEGPRANQSFAFTPTADITDGWLSIRLKTASPNGVQQRLGFDNFRLVPTPGAAAVLGAAGLLATRRRR